jgi:hypothetical protein
MLPDNIDRIIQEFIPENGSLTRNCAEVVTTMAGEISRLRHTHTVSQLSELDRPGGCWVSFSFSDHTHITSVHASELEALRYAMSNHDSGVLFLPYGITIHDALDAKENPQR